MEDKSRPQTEREFDLIVFGASGFTGQFVVEEVIRTAQKDPIKWAVSGRNTNKLNEVLANASKETGIDVKHIPTVEADINNEESLRAMTARTRLVLNCVGPYRFYGEQMVKSCVDTATNHLDISGEPQFLESMQLKYNSAAKEKGIYIVGSCGWDSIPVDLGVRFLKRNFEGELNAVETFMSTRVGPQGLRTNYGTWHSAIHGFAAQKELGPLRRRLYSEVFTKRAPKSKFKLQRKIFPFQSEYAKGWCLPFPGSDRSVVQRTEQYRYEEKNERPTQIEAYFTLPGLLALIGTLLMGAIFGTFASFKWGRSLLEAHPKFFSFGMFSKEGPTREQIRGASFVTTIVGKGWTEKLSEPSDEPTFPPNKTVVVRVRGHDPGYVATSTCLVQSGFTLLKESDKMPKNGGVLTPGAAFADTGIYDRLREHELFIEVVDQ